MAGGTGERAAPVVHQCAECVDVVLIIIDVENRVKLAIRSFTQTQIEQLCATALAMESTGEIRLLFNEALENAGLGGMVRAGK